MQRFLKEDLLNKVNQLNQIANELDITMSQLAIAWILRQENVASALVGATRPDQIMENAKASDISLSSDVLKQIEAILS